MVICLILAAINAIRAFDMSWVMTQGGPGQASSYFATMIYKRAFMDSQFAYGAAIAITLLIYILLLAGGVRVFEYQPTMMHSKTLVADGTWSTIGSMNFDNRSLAFNNESNLVIWDAAIGARLDSAFYDDLTRAREIDLAQFRKRPVTARMVEMGASVLQRIL